MSTGPLTTARAILAHAPLGALIRFSDGQPRPPERFKRKLRDWETRNGVGRLTERNPSTDGNGGTFALHLGNFGEGPTVIMSFSRVYSGDSRGIFTIERAPQPGEALIVSEWRGRTELLHLAPDEASARAWLREHHYPDARIDIVGATMPERDAA